MERQMFVTYTRSKFNVFQNYELDASMLVSPVCTFEKIGQPKKQSDQPEYDKKSLIKGHK